MELEPKFICNYLESIKLYTLEVPVLIKLFGPIEVQDIKRRNFLLIIITEKEEI